MSDRDSLASIVAELSLERTTVTTALSNTRTSADQQSRALREAWIALQTWMREKLVARRGAHIPNFCRLTWQIVEGTASGAPKSSSSSSTEGVLMRPVFALDEAFCNAHGLPWRKPAEALLPCCELEYSTLALRYSTFLTKDMVFGAVRDVVRRVGQRIASGARVRLELGVGALFAEHGRCSFAFDAAALAARRPEEERLPALAQAPETSSPRSDAGMPVSAREARAMVAAASRRTSTAQSVSRPSEREEDLEDAGNASSSSSSAPPPPPLPEEDSEETARDDAEDSELYSETQAARVNQRLNQSGIGVAGTLQQDSSSRRLNRSASSPSPRSYSELSDRCYSTGLLPQTERGVVELAYERCLAGMQQEADQWTEEGDSLKRRVLAAQQNDSRKLHHWKDANRELQQSLQDQIDAKKQRTDEEAATLLSTDLMTTQQMNTFSSANTALGHSASVAEMLGQPSRFMRDGPLKQYSLTAQPTRGRGSVGCVSERALRGENSEDISFRAEQARHKREAALSEERLFLKHVDSEIARCDSDRETKLRRDNRAMADAWETSQHMKNFKRLAPFGASAMLDYAALSAHRKAQAPQPLPPCGLTLPPTRQLQASLSGTLGDVGISVGFDPRDAPKHDF